MALLDINDGINGQHGRQSSTAEYHTLIYRAKTQSLTCNTLPRQEKDL